MRPFVLLFVATLAFGCTHTRAIRWSGERQAAPVEKISGSVAVMFGPGMRSHVESARPAGLLGLFHKYRFPVGKQLCEALLASVRNVHAEAVWVDSEPDADRYDRIIRFSIEQTRLEIAFRDAYLASASGRLEDRYEDARYTILVNVEVEGGDAGAGVRKMVLHGVGYSTEEFSLSIRAALDHLTGQVEALLSSQLQGPEPAQGPS